MRVAWTFIIAMLIGCSHKPDKQKFIDYINDPDNKITQQIKIGDVQATVKWLSPDYQKLKSEVEGMDSVATADKGFYYFDVRFDKVKGDKPSKEKLLYLDFDMQNDFVLLQGKDSIQPAICQKIENGVPGSYQYMLVFEKKDKGSDDQDFALIYRDKVFATGILAFVYKQEDIRKIPKLKREESK